VACSRRRGAPGAVLHPEPSGTPMRSFLPMANHVRGKRSPVTCALKCDNACLKATCNTSSNGYFRDIVDAKLSRRAVLGASAAGALAIAVSTAPSPTARSAAAAGSLDFTAIDPVHHDVDEFIVPEGCSWHPIVRWGDPLFPDSPRFDPDNQSPQSQRRQFGYNNDYLSIQIDGNDSNRAVLFANQEYTNDAIMYPDDMDEADQRAIS